MRVAKFHATSIFFIQRCPAIDFDRRDLDVFKRCFRLLLPLPQLHDGLRPSACTRTKRSALEANLAAVQPSQVGSAHMFAIVIIM